MVDAVGALDAAAIREAVRVVRRRVTLAAAWIYPVIAALAVLSFIEGESGWCAFWIVLLVVTLAFALRGFGQDRRRDDVALAGSDDAVRAYLVARLDVLAVTSRKVVMWLVIGGVFLLLGISDLLPPADVSLAGTAGDILLGGYFVVSRLHTRFVLNPWFARTRVAVGDPPPDARALLADRAHAVRKKMGEAAATVFRRETASASLSDLELRVRGRSSAP